VLHHVATQRVAVAARPGLALVQRQVGALAAPVGIAVRDEPGLEQGRDDVDQRVVQNPVSERRGTDAAPLGLVDGEVAVGAGLPAACVERGLKFKQPVGAPVF